MNNLFVQHIFFGSQVVPHENKHIDVSIDMDKFWITHSLENTENNKHKLNIFEFIRITKSKNKLLVSASCKFSFPSSSSGAFTASGSSTFPNLGIR